MKRQSLFPGTKSVPSPSAQTNKVCEVVNVGSKGIDSLLNMMVRVEMYPQEFKTIIELQYMYGLRVSEVLSIKHNDLKSNNAIIIKGKKGSSPRIIHVSFNQSYINRCRLNNVHPFPTYNRFYLHREYIKLGFTYKSKNSKKMSTTHSFRHKVIQKLRNENVDAETLQLFIGHKNQKNTNNYGRDKA